MTVRLMPPRPTPDRALMPLPHIPGPLDHLREIRRQLREVDRGLRNSRFASPRRRALVAYNTMALLHERLCEIGPEDRPGLVSTHAISQWRQATMALAAAGVALDNAEIRLHLSMSGPGSLMETNRARAALTEAAGHLHAMLTEKRP